jgi:hypothetical protein
VQYGAAGGIGERVEDGIEPGGVRLNHVVECSRKEAPQSTDWLNVSLVGGDEMRSSPVLSKR